MATKAPDENDRARGIGPPLPKHPGDDAVPMLDPRTGAAPTLEAGGDAKVEAEADAETAKAVAMDSLQAGKVGAFLDEAVTRMQRRHAKKERPIIVPWQSLADALGGGWWPGMYVMVGNTGSGKSQLTLQAALWAARAGTPVLYIGLELGRVDLVARLVSLMASKEKWSELYLGKSASLPTLRETYAEQLKELQELPFHLDIGGPFGWSYSELPARVRAMRELYPETDGPGSRPMLVVLDFLQLVSSPEGVREELRERIGRAAYVGRAVARDYDAAVLMVSSTSREHYGKLDANLQEKDAKGKPKENVEPSLVALVGLGKDSGEVEYAADAVLALRRQAWIGKDAPADGTTIRLAVAKGRAVVPDWVELRFNGSRFSEPNTAPMGRVRL